MTTDVWNDQASAAVDLVGRTGARHLEIGFLREDVPADQADWYAHAQYRGARIIVEHHTGPAEALEALAVKLLTGGQCNHCKGLVALSRDGAVFTGGQSVLGTTLTLEEARSRPQCLWHREGPHWLRGCAS